MNRTKNIRIEDYDYPLPSGQIAQYPLQARDASRLLVYNKGRISDKVFTDLPELLPPHSLLVFNDSRVIRARFMFYKPTGAKIEIFCLEPIAPTVDLQQAFDSRTESHWKCYIGGLKKWKQGKLQLEVPGLAGGHLLVWAEITGSEKDTVNIKFTWNNPLLSFSELMEACGHIPLPPYIARADEKTDASRYQTVYAREQGSVAAPTAGLHFTDEVLDTLRQKEFPIQWLTLHVGAGTFTPVSSDSIGQHEMHYENYSVTRDLIIKLLECNNKPVIPVGTTSMRTLESLYWLGKKIIRQGEHAQLLTQQWESYENDTESDVTEDVLKALLDYIDSSGINTLHAATGLLIAPGYEFRICSGLITNFHLPKSTLLLLVAALVGQDWRKAYQFALDRGFRFLSYGDSSLFLP